MSDLLSAREVDVLQALVNTGNRRAAARALHLEANTVKTHLQRIYRRMGVSSAVAAITIGFREGWLR